jgi:AcrR family transcriptional regulator
LNKKLKRLGEKMDKREEILNATETVFLKYGFKKSTLDDVAQQCAINKTGLYYYFKNRDDLFQSMFKKRIEKLQSKVKNAVKRAAGFEKKIHTFMQMKYEIVQDNKPFLDMFFQEELPNKTFVFLLKEKNKILDFDYNLIQSIIEEEIAKSKIQIKQIDSLIMMIMGVIYGMVYVNLVENKDFNLTEHIDDMLQIIMKGIEYKNET